jgi:hypothetical protein
MPLKGTLRREPAAIDPGEASHASSCALIPFIPPSSRIYRCRNRRLNKASVPEEISSRSAIMRWQCPNRRTSDGFVALAAKTQV